MGLFIDLALLPPGIFGTIQVTFLGAVYGYLLFQASNMISEGSELLLLVPRYASIVGSVILPILGAVPDGAIVLFSGLGDNAQERVSIGLGTLAGSTIMLITLPWAASIWMGMVPKGQDGRPNYSSNVALDSFKNGSVQNSVNIHRSGRFMMLSSLLYLVVQGPATYYAYTGMTSTWKSRESIFLLMGIVGTTIGFFIYLWISLNTESASDSVASRRRQAKTIEMLHEHMLSLDKGLEMLLYVAPGPTAVTTPRGTSTKRDPLLVMDSKTRQRLNDFLQTIFQELIDRDHSGTASFEEIRFLLGYFDSFDKFGGEGKYEELFKKYDVDGSGEIDFDEFVDLIIDFTDALHKEHSKEEKLLDSRRLEACLDAEQNAGATPTMFGKIPLLKRTAAITKSGFIKLMFGTFVVLFLSDPMCGVFENLGHRTSIPPFYLSFILAPMASNAAEALASVKFAARKTVLSAETSLSALTGAAIMNNTFCLMIFYLICYLKGLDWNFGPEVSVTLFIQVVMFFYTQKSNYTHTDAICIMSLMPMSLVMISLAK